MATAIALQTLGAGGEAAGAVGLAAAVGPALEAAAVGPLGLAEEEEEPEVFQRLPADLRGILGRRAVGRQA